MKLTNLIFCGAALLAGCSENDISSGEKKQVSPVDYLMFGHTGGFCIGCDAIYKITDGKLYGANHQLINDPDAVTLVLLPDSAYQRARVLLNEMPQRFFTGTTQTINHLGSYFPDVGHYYIEVSTKGNVYRWFVEANDIPSDVSGFVTDVGQVLANLN